VLIFRPFSFFLFFLTHFLIVNIKMCALFFWHILYSTVCNTDGHFGINIRKSRRETYLRTRKQLAVCVNEKIVLFALLEAKCCNLRNFPTFDRYYTKKGLLQLEKSLILFIDNHRQSLVLEHVIMNHTLHTWRVYFYRRH
jgi:hypothetical protein